MSRFTVIHTSCRGGEIRLDYDDLELATVESGPRSRGYEKTEIVFNEDGKVISLAEAQEMLREHERDMEDFFNGMAELDERMGREADAQWESIQRQARRDSLARRYDNDPGGYIQAVRELEDEENQRDMRPGF